MIDDYNTVLLFSKYKQSSMNRNLIDQGSYYMYKCAMV